jgi:hypothetical protein
VGVEGVGGKCRRGRVGGVKGWRGSDRGVGLCATPPSGSWQRTSRSGGSTAHAPTTHPPATPHAAPSLAPPSDSALSFRWARAASSSACQRRAASVRAW